MKQELKHLALKLRKLRRVRGYTLEHIKNVLQLKSHAQISQWENGEKEPSRKNIINLAILYHVSVDYLYKELRQKAIEEILPRIKDLPVTNQPEEPPQ